MAERYFARSASDNTDNWPFWFVADTTLGGLNVTADVIRTKIDKNHRGGTLVGRDDAIKLCELANAPKEGGA